MVRFDSWRAVGAGNRADRNLATKSTYGGRAARQKGNRASVGEARGGRGNRDPRTSPERAADHLGVGKGQMYRRSRVMPMEGRALASGEFVKEERTGEWRWALGRG